MIDFNSPLEDWDLITLQRYMAWKVIEGITTGQKVDSVVWEFPVISIQWHLAQQSKNK